MAAAPSLPCGRIGREGEGGAGISGAGAVHPVLRAVGRLAGDWRHRRLQDSALGRLAKMVNGEADLFCIRCNRNLFSESAPFA